VGEPRIRMKSNAFITKQFNSLWRPSIPSGDQQPRSVRCLVEDLDDVKLLPMH
jgi:hypothetical protein